ncbi:MAG TPA: DUF3810 domain-containing protein [Vicinamibacteria bacterium]|nr:DUF3810 domain-containing protein [Vicinamibacteria bacterium]
MKRAQYSTRTFPHPVLLAALPAALALQWAASRSPDLVERVYATALYPRLALLLASVSGLVRFSVGEALLAILAGTTLFGLARLTCRVRAAKGQRLRLAGAAAARVLAAAGAVYLAFVLLWGLNYHRPPFAVITGLGTETTGVALAELEALSADLVVAANQARTAVPEDAQGVFRVAGGVSGVLARSLDAVRGASTRYTALRGPFARPKPVLFSTGLSYLGISGIYLPFTAEANVNDILPDSQLPFTAAHELAHQAGIAPEDEANFVAYVACTRHPEADFRYSGWFNAALYALGALAQADAERARRRWEEWSPAVRRDLAALTAWNERYRGPAETAARAVNDAYLKSQGVPEGVRSYAGMVNLLILERRARSAASR